MQLLPIPFPVMSSLWMEFDFVSRELVDLQPLPPSRARIAKGVEPPQLFILTPYLKLQHPQLIVNRVSLALF